MRLGLGLNFLHRLITVAVAAEVPSAVNYLLQQTGDFLLLEERDTIILVTQEGDTLITQNGFSLITAQSESTGQIQLEQ